MSFSGTVRSHDGQGHGVWKITPVEGTEESTEVDGETKTYRMYRFSYTLVRTGQVYETNHHHWDHRPIEEMLGFVFGWVSRQVPAQPVVNQAALH